LKNQSSDLFNTNKSSISKSNKNEVQKNKKKRKLKDKTNNLYSNGENIKKIKNDNKDVANNTTEIPTITNRETLENIIIEKLENNIKKIENIKEKSEEIGYGSTNWSIQYEDYNNKFSKKEAEKQFNENGELSPIPLFEKEKKSYKKRSNKQLPQLPSWLEYKGEFFRAVEEKKGKKVEKGKIHNRLDCAGCKVSQASIKPVPYYPTITTSKYACKFCFRVEKNEQS
jgi:hypothetical protein